MKKTITVDVEEWFHILDTPVAPEFKYWGKLESRVEIGLNRILELLDKYSVKATMFWLGWMAERNKSLLLRCYNAGHEIASHGYAHLLAYEAGPEKFYEDIKKAKNILESIISAEVIGFRAAGFSIKGDTDWASEKIAQAGYVYDSSVFPAARGHGGNVKSKLAPYVIETTEGNVVEIPQSIVEILGKRVSFFGGGYLRIAPGWLINYGIRKLHAEKRPLLIYVHPRELDIEHPRLKMSAKRRFKSYVNLKSTCPKLEMLCLKYEFITIKDMIAEGFVGCR
jgi:polysaccharide deacetylase family protein (PEP-CTERM system associated)